MCDSANDFIDETLMWLFQNFIKSSYISRNESIQNLCINHDCDCKYYNQISIARLNVDMIK